MHTEIDKIVDIYLHEKKGAYNAYVALRLSKAKGVLTKHEYLQMLNTGIPLCSALSVYLNLSDDEIHELIDSNTIRYNTVVEALLAY